MPSTSLALPRSIQLTRPTQVYYLGWLAVAALSIGSYLWARYFGLTFTDPDYYIIIDTILISTSLVFYGIFGRTSRVGEMIRCLTLWMTTYPVGCAFTYLLATLRFPIIDRNLDRFDKALGFDWLSWYHFINANSDIKMVLAAAYASVAAQIYVSIIYFSHRQEGHRSNELWWTCTISMVITTLVSGVLPAMGAFEYYGIADAQHGGHLHDLHGLRDGTLTSFSLNTLKGIVTLPSYHTVLAILLTYIYRNQRRMLAVVLPLNLLMLVAIPSEGGHYLADMLAGGAVAALSIWTVRRTALGRS